MRCCFKLVVLAMLGLVPGYFCGIAQPTTGRFLLLKPSAVSMGMGGTGVAFDRSPFAAYSNVAGLAFLPTINFAGSFVEPVPLFEDVRQSFLTGSHSFPGIGTIGISANLYWKGVQHTVGPLFTENLLDWYLKLSYARAISKNFSAGISVGALRMNMDTRAIVLSKGTGAEKSTSLLLDAGIMYRSFLPSATFLREDDDSQSPIADWTDGYSSTGLSFGLAVSNFGPKITAVDDQLAAPPAGTLTAGVAYSPVRMTSYGFLIALDAEKELFDASVINYLHWGGELTLFKLIALRGGYFQDTSGPHTSYWTWGAGLRFRFLHLNVARYTRAILPSWHFDGAFIWEF